MTYDHKKEQRIKRQIDKIRRKANAEISALSAELTKPLNLNYATLKDMKGKHYQRRAGTVVYELIDMDTDHSYFRDYNFVTEFAKLRRLSNGTGKTVELHDFNHYFIEVE